MHIPGFRGLSAFSVIKKSVKKFGDDDMLTYASALSYQVLFSVFPFVIFLIALLGFLELPDLFNWLRQQAQLLLPAEAMDQVDRVIKELQYPQGGLLSFGAIASLWIASSSIRAIMNALNGAYDVAESRPAWKLYPLSILYTLGTAAMLIVAAVLLMIGPEVMQWLAQQIGLEKFFVVLWTWLRLPVSLFVLMLAVAIVYYAAPNVRHPFQFISPGSMLAVTVWIVASLGFSFYVQNFADYSAMYGSIGTIIVLLLYFYISAAVLLFGAEVNAVVEREAPRP